MISPIFPERMKGNMRPDLDVVRSSVACLVAVISCILIGSGLCTSYRVVALPGQVAVGGNGFVMVPSWRNLCSTPGGGPRRSRSLSMAALSEAQRVNCPLLRWCRHRHSISGAALGWIPSSSIPIVASRITHGLCERGCWEMPKACCQELDKEYEATT